MNVTFDSTDLEPIVRAVVAQTLAEWPSSAEPGKHRLSYLEPEAAELLGVAKHVLRDARIRGEIVATKIGRCIAYERGELLAYLARNREARSR